MIDAFLHALESIFAWLIEASWQASVLVVLVLLLHLVLRRRLNPRWHHALWLLVIARLLLPFLPESALSLFQFAPSPPLVVTATVTEPIFQSAPEPMAATTWTPAPRAYSFSTFTLLALGWFVGVMVLLVLTWQVNRRFARHVTAALPVSDPRLLQLAEAAQQELGIHRRLRLIESAQVQSPAIMGLFRTTLILPQDVRTRFDDEELRFIFLHEFAHLKRGDLFLQWLVALLQILHWFNPVLWYAFRRMRADREPATDALVLSCTGEASKESYGQVLVKLLEHYHQRHSLPTLVGILEDKDQFKRRFSLIARFTRGAYGWSLLGVLLIGILSVACLTKSHAAAIGITDKASNKEIAALVNNQPIYWWRVTYDRIDPTTSLKAKYSGDELRRMVRLDWESVVQFRIDYELTVQEAEAEGYRVPQDAIESKIAFCVKGFGGNKHLFVENLRRNGITLEQFEKMCRDDIAFSHFWGMRVNDPAIHYAESHIKSSPGSPTYKTEWQTLFRAESIRLTNKLNAELESHAVIQRFAVPQELLASTLNPSPSSNPNGKVPASGEDALIAAVENNHIEDAKLLLQNGANPNVQDSVGPLVALAPNVEFVQLLIQHGADIHALSKDRRTVIECAILAGNGDDLDVIEELIKQGADLDPKGQSGAMALGYAAGYNDVKIMKLLMDRGVSPNVYGKENYMETSPLGMAAWRHNTEAVKLLLDRGANPEGDPRQKMTPLSGAIMFNERENAKLLRAAGAHDVGDLSAAVAAGATPKVMVLLQGGSDVNEVDRSGNTPLHYAVRRGDVDMAKLLLAHGANINQFNSFGYTPTDSLDLMADSENPKQAQMDWDMSQEEGKRRSGGISGAVQTISTQSELSGQSRSYGLASSGIHRKHLST